TYVVSLGTGTPRRVARSHAPPLAPHASQRQTAFSLFHRADGSASPCTCCSDSGHWKRTSPPGRRRAWRDQTAVVSASTSAALTTAGVSGMLPIASPRARAASRGEAPPGPFLLELERQLPRPAVGVGPWPARVLRQVAADAPE